MVLCHAVAEPPSVLAVVRAELAEAGIELPAVVAATKSDEAAPGAVARLAAAVRPLPVVEVSVLHEDRMARFRDAVWELTGLSRVYLRRGGQTDPDPVALPPPVTVADVADSIHHDLAARCRGGRVWGASARFPGQRVGPAHQLADGDTVEVLT